jgi:hypothetical protein
MIAFVRYRRWSIAVYVAVVLSCVSLGAQTKSIPHNDQRYTLTFPNLRTVPGERVVGFSVNVDSGRIASVPEVPIGWSIAINNDASWNTKLTATVEVGAAALDAGFFRDFVVIEKSSLGGGPFAVRCEVVVTKDFKSERHIQIERNDLALRRTTN